MAWFKTPKQIFQSVKALPSNFLRGAKNILSFNLTDYAPEGSKVQTGTLPIGGLGSGALKLASKTKSFYSGTAKVIKPFVPKSTTGKIFAGTSTIIGAGILKESVKARGGAGAFVKNIPNVPKNIFGFGESIGEVIEGEKTFGKEDVIAGAKKAGVAGAIIGAGALIIPKVIDKIKNREEKPITPPSVVPQVSEGVFKVTPEQEQMIKEKPIGIEGEKVITPETISITPKKRTYKRRVAKKPQSIRQSVNVNVVNRSTGLRITNKRYLKEAI